MRVTQEVGECLRMEAGEGASGWTYRYGGGLPKPCVHPWVTGAGCVVTGFEPSDHVWHRGLWFTIKHINGENFWEEHAPFGVQRSVREPGVEVLEGRAGGAGGAGGVGLGGGVRVRQGQVWESEVSGVVLEEEREMVWWGAGEKERVERGGGQVMDFSTRLRATKDLVLDRTPYTTWGGYGGLSFRAAREMHQVVFETPGGESKSIAGDRHDWLVMRGLMDGGRDRRVSMGVMEHGGNPRSPTPWYAKTGDGFTFWNAAFLFHESMRLGRGEELRLGYRVVLRDGVWGPGEFAGVVAGFRAAGGAGGVR